MRVAGVVLAAALAAATAARAQVLEDVAVRRDGDLAVIEVRFAGKVQYLRSSLDARRRSLQVFFRPLERDSDGSRTVEEFRRPPPNELVPRFTVTFPIQPAAGDQRLDIAFEQRVDAKVRAGADNRTVRIELPAPKLATAPPAPSAAPPAAGTPSAAATPPPAAAAPPGAAPAEGDGPAQVALARAALEAGRLDEAVGRLNGALNLPPNTASREAQELIGVVRERRGELARAKVEYELFLKLHPQGADADRVRTRLAALAGTPAARAAPAAAPPSGPRSTVWGSVSQAYFGGQIRSDSQVRVVTPATDATTIDTLSISGTEQSAIVTNIDANARFSGADWDHRLVLRDTHTASFLKDQPSRNRLTSLYAESRYDPARITTRFGRQSSTLGGILGRFDGAIAGIELWPRVRLSAVGGRPVDLFDTTLQPAFYGMAMDFDGVGERWSGTAYAIQQGLQGRTDRRALGAEARYFDARRSLVGFIDYDASFRVVNIAMLQGNWQLERGTAFNLLADFRRTPPLQLSNALLAGRGLAFADYLDTFGEPQARRDAKDATPISRLFYVGVTQPLTSKWQLGADVRVSSLSATPGIGLLPGTRGTGMVYTYSLQAIGSSLFGNGDVTLLNASRLTGAVNRAFSTGIAERLTLGERWVVEPSLRWYHQRDDLDVSVGRISTGLKLSYKVRETLLLDAEVNWERTRTEGESADNVTARRFYYLGYRWAF